jgi:branched-subunit amino acid transport protein AzlD
MFEKIISFIITIEVVEIGMEETRQFKFIVYTRQNTPKEQRSPNRLLSLSTKCHYGHFT